MVYRRNKRKPDLEYTTDDETDDENLDENLDENDTTYFESSDDSFGDSDDEETVNIVNDPMSSKYSF